MYCKLPTNGKQLPAFPLKAVTGIEPRPQRWEARVLALCHRGPLQSVKPIYLIIHFHGLLFNSLGWTLSPLPHSHMRKMRSLVLYWLCSYTIICHDTLCPIHTTGGTFRSYSVYSVGEPPPRMPLSHYRQYNLQL